jgi:hypothetical protein
MQKVLWMVMVSRGCHMGLHNKSAGIYQQVSLSTFDFFVTVVAYLLLRTRCGFDRLAINNCSGWFDVFPEIDSYCSGDESIQ